MKKYIKFEEIPFNGKTKRFKVISISSGDILGGIKWNTGWRQYTFEPSYPTIWSDDCLNDIVNFLIKINSEKLGKKILTNLAYIQEAKAHSESIYKGKVSEL